jgi:hypothetical protein
MEVGEMNFNNDMAQEMRFLQMVMSIAVGTTKVKNMEKDTISIKVRSKRDHVHSQKSKKKSNDYA